MYRDTPPSHFKLSAGCGDGEFPLNALDRALTTAGIGNYNIVKVTSILPPGAAPGELDELAPGQLVHAAMASITSDQPGELISAAVAAGIPEEPGPVGVLMEGSRKGSATDVEAEVRRMAQTAMEDRGAQRFRVESAAVEWRVKRVGAAVAVVLLW